MVVRANIDAMIAMLGALGWCPPQAMPNAGPEATSGQLSASQIGYGSKMQKLFTSPQEFRSFRVVKEPDGAAAFVGGARSGQSRPSSWAPSRRSG